MFVCVAEELEKHFVYIKATKVLFEAHATSRYLCLILVFECGVVSCVVQIVVDCFAFKPFYQSNMHKLGL